MFYAHFVLSKKGPLARIWLAAHWDKKLTKAHIFETSIEGSVEAIMQPQVKLALRTSGHLLLGVVRIYSRKAKYLLDDCNAAIVKIKMAFRPGAVDLPEEGREAAVTAVTMPENFYEFDSFLPAVNISDFDIQARYAVHQSQPEEITLREDSRTVSFFINDDFGDFDNDGIALPDARADLGLYARSERIAEFFEPRSERLSDGSGGPRSISPAEQSSADQSEDMETEPMPAAQIVDAEPETVQITDVEQTEKLTTDDNGNVMKTPKRTSADVYNYEPVGADETMESEFGGQIDADFFGEVEGGELFEEPKTPAPVTASQSSSVHDDVAVQPTSDQTMSAPDQTTIINNDAEAFALGPIDATTVGTERKARKKRKLIIDAHKLIPSETMRGQLRRSADLLIQLDLAPPTKKLMEWKEYGGADKLLVMPGKRLVNSAIGKLFSRGLVTRPVSDDDEVKVKRRKRHVDADAEVSIPAFDVEEPLEPAAELSAVDNEMRRGASTSGADMSINMSHVSAAVIEPEADRGASTDEPSIRADVSNISLPSAMSDTSVIAAADISLPTIQDIGLPGIVDDLANIRSPMSVGPLPSPRSVYAADISSAAPYTDVADDTAFNETLQSAAADITLVAEGENEEDVQVLNRRSGQLLHAIQRVFETQADVAFRDLVRRNIRKQVAAKFHTLLVLKTLQAVDVEQQQLFGDIYITRGPNFDTIVLQ